MNWPDIVCHVVDPIYLHHSSNHPVREADFPQGDVLIAELRFLAFDRKRMPLPASFRLDGYTDSLSWYRESPRVGRVIFAPEGVNDSTTMRTLKQEILMPFTRLDHNGVAPPETLYIPALPCERVADVLERLRTAETTETGEEVFYDLADPSKGDEFIFQQFREDEDVKGPIRIYRRPAFADAVINLFGVLVYVSTRGRENLHFAERTRQFARTQMVNQMDAYFEYTTRLRDAVRQGTWIYARSNRSVWDTLTEAPEEGVAFPHYTCYAETPRRRAIPFQQLAFQGRVEAEYTEMFDAAREEIDRIRMSMHRLRRKIFCTQRALRNFPARTLARFVPSSPDTPWAGTVTVELRLPRTQEIPHSIDLLLPHFSAEVRHLHDRVRSNERLLTQLEQRRDYPTCPPTPGLQVTLYPYQQETVGFMCAAEATPRGMYESLWIPVGDGWLSPVLGLASPALPVPDENHITAGGFLADEVGLGKTIETLALVRASPAPPDLSPQHTRGTLIVCPLTIVAQWAEMIERILPDAHVCVFHGPRRPRDSEALKAFEIVLTTYETMTSEFRLPRLNTSPLFALTWHRVVFDESHTVGRGTIKTAASGTLKSRNRWCVSATPFGTAVDEHELAGSVEEVESQLQMLQFNGRVNTWRTARKFLFGVTVRHSKQCAQPLPPLEVHQHGIPLGASAAAIYQEAEQRVVEEIQRVRIALVEAYNPSTLERYALSLLHPLRMFCSTGTLPTLPIMEHLPGAVPPQRGAEGDHEGTQRVTHLFPPEEECPICIQHMDEPHLTPCNHWFCGSCITHWLVNRALHVRYCPMCRQSIRIADLQKYVPLEGATGPAPEAAEVEERGVDEIAEGAPDPLHVHAPKLEFLFQEVQRLHTADPSSKFLVFSQNPAMVREVVARFKRLGLGVCSIDGSMSLVARKRAIHRFDDPDVLVMALDYRTSSFGINLTAANHLFLLDQPLRPAAVRQAIGRAHRNGQLRPVHVHHLLFQNTIEERVHRLEGRVAYDLLPQILQ